MVKCMSETNKIKVLVHMFSEEVICGYIYLHEKERLQDLMNDDRIFLPLLKIDPTNFDKPYPTVLINKHSITRIEERLV